MPTFTYTLVYVLWFAALSPIVTGFVTTIIRHVYIRMSFIPVHVT